MGKTVKLPQMAWYGDTELEISLPDHWQVTVHGIEADHWPVPGPEQIREVINNPTGQARLKELARGKKEVAIIFDDMTRPTPVTEIASFILAELKEAGIPDQNIRFIAALGAHGAHDRLDFEKKLGPEIIRRFPVYNHNPYENCIRVGTTSRGTVVEINKEVADCDLKVAIGSILPHPFMGFGGGGKIIMPGICSIDSIQANHLVAIKNLVDAGLGPVDGLGRYEDNETRKDVEEAAAIAGLDFLVNVLVNSRRQVVGVVAGDHIKAYHQGLEIAKKLYGTERPEDVDVIIANANAKGNEASIAVLFSAACIKETGGDLVLIVDTPGGQVTHYLLSSFGKKIGGRLWNPHGYLPEKVRRVIVLSRYQDSASGKWFGPAEKLHWVETWDEVMALLNEKHGPGTRAAVLVDGTMQYFK
jgi:nickel-dependent lactate racemase